MNSTQRNTAGRRFFFVACCLVSAAFGFAADPPAFVIQSSRDEQPAGPLARMGSDGAVQLAGSPSIAGRDLVAIRRKGVPPPHFPHDRPYARFANGDQIPGQLLSIVDDKVRFAADVGTPQEISLPLSSLFGVWLTDSASVSSATLAGRRAAGEKRRQDVVQLSNGDTAAGTVIGWAADGPLRLDAAGRKMDLPRERVQSLLLNTDLARAAKPRSAYRQIVLLNGARIGARTAELVGNEIIATMLLGPAIRLPLNSLAAINVYQGAAVYLSDLAPRAYEHSPYLGTRWPLEADRSAAGLDLRLGGGTYDKGLGMHSRSRVTYALPKGARRFEAVVGLDERSGRLGNVRVEVRADGKALLDPPLDLAGTDPPRMLRLNLPPGSRELELSVDFGRGGDVQDHVDWADARVIVDGAAGP